MDFRILGPLEIRQNEQPLPCKGAKQRLLLAVLLLRANEVVSSDHLIDALWAENPPPTANKALQMHVSQLRRLLEPGLLVTRPPGYELRVGDWGIDLQLFEAHVTRARAAAAAGRTDEASTLFAEALALWRGPPLADLTFERVLQPDIARLEELRLAALEDWIDADLALGRHVELIGELERLAAEHPLREGIRRQLMLALYRSGRQAEALDVYTETRKRLVEELGLEPGRELTELQQQILGHDPALDLGARPGLALRPPAEGLVGRESELGRLSRTVEEGIAGRGAIVLIGGEPGIGKSRMAEALARHAAAAGARVAVGRSWEAGGAPAFWPWVQALRALLREDKIEQISDLVGPALDDQETEGTRFRMFQSIAGLLRLVAGEAPTAVFLDDLHAADAPSLLLLRFLAGELADTRIAVVGCYRDTEAGPVLAETLAELARDPIVERVGLKGLDAEATSRLLAATIGARPPPELAARVQAETRGNPLFVGELGRLFASEGIPADADEHLPVPEGVREAIRRRVQQRSERCRTSLALASVVGREFELVTVARVGGLSEDELSAAIQEATVARLVEGVPGTDERLRFSHILVRDTLYEDIPAPVRLRLHGAVAGALEVLHGGNPGPWVAQLAHHHLAAGREASSKAIDYCERAGEAAASQYAYEEAARWYSRALETIERHLASDPERECDLLLARAEALSRAGSGADAKEACRRAAALAEEHGWPDRLARAALAYGGRFAWARASTDAALTPMLERALERVGTRDALTRARLFARVAAAKRDDTSRDARTALAAEALETARHSDDLTTLAYALEGYWVAAEGPDDVRAGITIGDELISIGQRLGDLERVFTGHDFRLRTYWKLADRAGIDFEVETVTKLAEDMRQAAQRWAVGTSHTMLALMEGRFDDAERLIAETRAIGERAETWNAGVSERLELFVLRRAQGRLAEVEDAVRRGVHEYPSLLRFRCALACLYGELADEPNARAVLDDLLARDLAREHVDAEWLFSINLLPDVCRFLADPAAAEQLYPTLAPYEGLYAEAPVEVTFGSVARGVGVLATTLGRYDDAERHLERAIETERRMRARPWLAHAQHDLAAMLLARGRRGDARRAQTLIDDAVGAYRTLGMDSWAERALALAA
jgi:DNA-binding SARP family transcriptional activator